MTPASLASFCASAWNLLTCAERKTHLLFKYSAARRASSLSHTDLPADGEACHHDELVDRSQVSVLVLRPPRRASSLQLLDEVGDRQVFAPQRARRRALQVDVDAKKVRPPAHLVAEAAAELVVRQHLALAHRLAPHGNGALLRDGANVGPGLDDRAHRHALLAQCDAEVLAGIGRVGTQAPDQAPALLRRHSRELVAEVLRRARRLKHLALRGLLALIALRVQHHRHEERAERRGADVVRVLQEGGVARHRLCRGRQAHDVQVVLHLLENCPALLGSGVAAVAALHRGELLSAPPGSYDEAAGARRPCSRLPVHPRPLGALEQRVLQHPRRLPEDLHDVH